MTPLGTCAEHERPIIGADGCPSCIAESALRKTVAEQARELAELHRRLGAARMRGFGVRVGVVAGASVVAIGAGDGISMFGECMRATTAAMSAPRRDEGPCTRFGSPPSWNADFEEQCTVCNWPDRAHACEAFRGKSEPWATCSTCGVERQSHDKHRK